jgi:4-hydroxy-tetrahydrodipicolinate synthase
VAPYYNKPTPEGIFQHYKAINDAVDLPIIVYNVPSRTVIDIGVEALGRLAELPNVVGIKDATAKIERVTAMRLLLGDKFCQLSGEDSTDLAFLAHGGHGCISVTANVAPRLCADFHDAWNGGRPRDALTLNDRLMPLHLGLFLETSPAPVKYAVSLLGRCSEEVRLPLVPPKADTKGKVAAAMRAAGVLN